LNIGKILIPENAGLLSAYGIGQALIERFVSSQVLKPWKVIKTSIPGMMYELEANVTSMLQQEGFTKDQIHIRDRFFYLRFEGQDHTIEIRGQNNIIEKFKKEYLKLFGHWIDNREIELESVKVVGCNLQTPEKKLEIEETGYKPESDRLTHSFLDGKWKEIAVYIHSKLNPGASITGPAIIASSTSTTLLEEDWHAHIDALGSIHIEHRGDDLSSSRQNAESPEEVQLELFSNRFTSIAETMGALFQRTSFSVNIKERLDFSCAILDEDGYLVVNAPHIPVHLGGLGICVREIGKKLEMKEGDIVITNHPGFGGSHLPDITLVSPVFLNSELIGYVANRGHHAEIGGSRPGSMPPNATTLEEEGVVIYPEYLVKEHEAQWEAIERVFHSAKYPSRAIEENMADLNGAVASIRRGVNELKDMAVKYGTNQILEYMAKIKDHSHKSLVQSLKVFRGRELKASELLDNGAQIMVSIKVDESGIEIDFDGTSPQQVDNMNATPAVAMSAILYVLRLLSKKPIPLNEGLLESVSVNIPPSLLNPDFSGSPDKCPPVVGGNTETSQRLVDTLLKAFGIAACSQGTMNNFLFGNESFAYYETICGGVGAVENHDGADAVHQHMTNTRITDPEILEHRYPVSLDRFEIRKNSGGKGRWKGGDGVIRQITFHNPVEVTILSQHRVVAPYGINGGEDSKNGEQWIETANGEVVQLKWKDKYSAQKGDRIVICTPGGGGYGALNY